MGLRRRGNKQRKRASAAGIAILMRSKDDIFPEM
jgi:hypothetical protein